MVACCPSRGSVQENMLQLQLNDQIGMTYDNLIKLSLRHRPDLLIIGEIRDKETARAVVRASLTGVTVFSTIHAKSVRGVYERLLELGVSEEELKIVLQGICYQRLIAGGGVVDFATLDDVLGLLVDLVADGLCIVAGRGDKKVQRLHSCIAGTFGHNIK